MNKKGFTLIEVMITITILAGLTILTATSIRQATKQKRKVQDNVDTYGVIRDAMGIIKKDINLGYHYRDIEQELKEKVENQKPKDPSRRVTRPQQGDRQDPTTHFVGTATDLNFATSNASLALSGSSDIGEVGYSLKRCKSRSSGETVNCLWRRFAPTVDEDVTQGGTDIALLENVEEFGFRYIGEGKQDWVSEWRSTEGGDAVTKGNFPDAVEVTLSVKQPDGRVIPLQAIVPIHFPNNKDKSEDEPQRRLRR